MNLREQAEGPKRGWGGTQVKDEGPNVGNIPDPRLGLNAKRKKGRPRQPLLGNRFEKSREDP